MKNKNILSAQPIIKRPEDLERALLNGEVVFGCGRENEEGSYKYVFIVRCGFFFLFENRSNGLKLHMVEKYNPYHNTLAYHSCECLYHDKSGLVDLDIRKLKYV